MDSEFGGVLALTCISAYKINEETQAVISLSTAQRSVVILGQLDRKVFRVLHIVVGTCNGNGTDRS